MVFSTNQVRHLYVAKSIKSEGNVSNSDTAGTIKLEKKEGSDFLQFQYKGANTLMRSDLIKIDNILHVNAVKASAASQKRTLKSVIVKLDSDVNEGNPIAAQDYVLRICINPYVGMSDEEPYIKYGVVHATKGMKTGKFYTMLAASLYKNFSRELSKMLEFTIDGKVVDGVRTANNGTETLLDDTGAAITIAETYADGITITECPQEWTLGIKEQVRVNFDIIPTTVIYDGEEVTWGKVTENTASTATIGNGKTIADLEYFCMGERGDQYRNIGWPNSIPTTYLVDATKDYDVLTIHYAYVGDNENPQKSEKDIAIVADSTTTIISTLLGTLNTLTGMSVAMRTE